MSAHPDYKHLEIPGLIIATVNTFILQHYVHVMF